MSKCERCSTACRGRFCKVCEVMKANEALAKELSHESVWEDGEGDDD